MCAACSAPKSEQHRTHPYRGVRMFGSAAGSAASTRDEPRVWSKGLSRFLDASTLPRSEIGLGDGVVCASGSPGQRKRVVPSRDINRHAKGPWVATRTRLRAWFAGAPPLGSSRRILYAGGGSANHRQRQRCEPGSHPMFRFAGSQGGSQRLRPVHGFRDDWGMSGCRGSERDILCLQVGSRCDVTSAPCSVAPGRCKPLAEKIVD